MQHDQVRGCGWSTFPRKSKQQRVVEGFGMNVELCKAAKHGDVAAIKSLVSRGAHPNCRGKERDGYVHRDTPLHWAARFDRLDCIATLLGANASVDMSGESCKSALGAAIWIDSHPRCVYALIEAKANVEWRDDNGWTPLHLAAHMGCSTSLLLLLRAGAVVDALCNCQRTPLRRALDNKRAGCALILVEAGADLSLLDKRSYPWFRELLQRRANCTASVFALCGVLRKRLGVHRDMVSMIANIVWRTRIAERWRRRRK